MKKVVGYWLLVVGFVVAVFLLDRITKLLILNYLAPNESIELTSFFSITYITNTGIAFGLFQNANILLTIITIAVIGIIIYYLKDLTKTKLSSTATALILGGALGNLLDRFLYSSVIDFINFSFWPAFNVADSAITVGGLMLIFWLRKE